MPKRILIGTVTSDKTWQVKDRVTAGGTKAVEADLDVEAATN